MAGTVVKGDMQIVVDSLELEAKLSFSPAKEGPEWSGEGILKLLGEKRITPLPSPKFIEEILQRFAKAKGPVAETVVKGEAPVPPVPEQVTWSDLPVPPELAALVPEVAAKTGNPVLYQIRVEKIKRETEVTKPGPLPFLPPKKEIVVTYDKKEVQEPVYVDPTVLDYAYAQRGQRVGLVAPPKPGKPGKSVYGKPVPPDTSADAQFFLGNGLVRDKNEIKAERTGVVRIGRNWADMLPLASHSWRVERGTDNVTFFLYFEPGNPRLPLPLAADIISAAVSQGARQADLLAEPELLRLIQDAVQKGEALLAHPLSRLMDGMAEVVVSKDALLATLNLRKSLSGGNPLTLKAISEAIRNSRVRGFDVEKVKADIMAFIQGQDIELKDYILVQGKAPSRGKEKEIKLTLSVLGEAERKEQIERLAADPKIAANFVSEFGFPLEECTHIAVVQKGARIGIISQPPSGSPGMDVYGREIPGLPGNDPDIRVCPGISLRPPDIIAEKSGILCIKHVPPLFQACILEYQDAQITVSLSSDAMEARLSLVRESGLGKPLTAEAVNQALAEAGVVRGIDGSAVAEALKIALETGSCSSVLVARGQAPVPAGERSITWLADLKAGPEGNGVIKKTAVKEGQLLARVIDSGAEGRAGFDVKGTVLSPEKGTSVKIQHDESILEKPIENGFEWYAKRTGDLVFDGWTAKITSLFAVKTDVGPATGNINFVGEVRIAGSVKSGFAVFGGQDVLIGGTVEAALVSSGGKVVVSQGIIGGGKGVVRARKTIEASFVEQATLLAVEHIRIQNGCLGSNVKTNGRLILVSERGNFVGGLCRARQGVDAANLGSERAIHTEVSFGQDYLIMDQIEVAEREIEKIKKALQDIEMRLKKLEASGSALDAVRAEKVRLMKLLEKYGLHLFTLREKFEEHHGSEIRVRGTVYPGVVMESHGRYYEVKQKRTGVVFYFNRDTGRIQEKNL
ncbi:MAG: FapA family protein [Treponema sp.]|nr:FapA family protein [Treponema sp.]